MPLSDTAIRALKPQPHRYERADEHGLFLEVLPTGEKSWRFRYRLNGRREKVTIGPYPDVSLAEARERRQECAKLIAKGDSPAQLKQRQKTEALKVKTVREIGDLFCTEVVDKSYRRPADARRYFTRDIFPVLGHYPLRQVTPEDVMLLVERIRGRGSEQAARMGRGLLKRMFDYAIVRRAIHANPVAEISPKVAGSANSRTRVLSQAELRQFLLNLDAADDSRALKIALRLILLTLVRKGELTRARWEHVDFDNSEWLIPSENSKTGKPHIVYLSPQAVELFKGLKSLAGKSEWVLPGRGGRKPTSAHTLNVMVYRHRVDNKPFGLTDFVIHDLRRTGSTMLHEAGFQSDVIEKALNHTIKGVRGVYNRAEYAEQRRAMLKYWAGCLDTLTAAENVITARFARAA